MLEVQTQKATEFSDEDEEEFSAPNLKEFRELPVGSFMEWDKVGEVKTILRALRVGHLRDAAILCDQMLEDDRIAGDLTTRTNGLLGSPLEMKAAVDNRKGNRISAEAMKLWPRMVPDSQLSDLHRWGLMLGIGIGELVWDTSGALWVPRLKVWHPQHCWFDWHTRSYWVMTENDSRVELPRVDETFHSDGRWVVYTPYGYQRGWMRALVRSLALPWLIRQWTYRDAARYSEVHGMPGRKAITPAQADAKEKNRFLQKTANMANEPAILCPQGADGNRYDVQLLEAVGRSGDVFERLIDRSEKSISIRILGQDASNRAQGGSLADAKENIRDDYKRADAKTLGETCTNQILWWWTGYNFKDTAFAPTIAHNVEPADDELDEAQKLSALASALDGLAKYGVDVRAVLELHGLPLLDDAEWAALRQLVATMAPTPPAFGGGVGAPPNEEGPPPRPGAPTPPPEGESELAQLRASDAPPPMGRAEYAGMAIVIENKKGTLRPWYDAGGKTAGATMMHHDYGFIDGHMGADGDEVDCYLGPDGECDHVYVVHQRRAPDYKAFDEDKVMFGFKSEAAAKDAFMVHRTDGDQAYGGMSVMPLSVFKAKLKRRTGTGKIRASEDGTRGAIALLSAAGRLGADAKRPTYGKKRAGKYAPMLTERARERARDALSPDLKAIREEVEKVARNGGGFAALKAGLTARFKAMDPGPLARVVERALVMAELAGHHDVLREV